MAATRKLAAILAADVVGYSRLMGEDEAGTARAVREHREAAVPIVREHGRRLVKTMGDGVLLEFPSVVAAVECAIAMQTQMVEHNARVPEARRILYRIGVNLGDVLIDGEDILGDGVNIAARLEGIAEPGGVCISGCAYDHVRGRIDAEFVDLGEKPLKNIARPVRVYAIKSERGGVASTVSVATGETAGPPRLSIVVLPFVNMSGDPEQEYFADEVTESLTTDLSRASGMVVIGRSTAFIYKGKAVDLKQIGRDLNVRYVLEGSIRRAGGRMRVNVQLIDAETGSHLLGGEVRQACHRSVRHAQDEIVARLAAQLQTTVIVAEARRAERAAIPVRFGQQFWRPSNAERRPPLENEVHRSRSRGTRAHDAVEWLLTIPRNGCSASVECAWAYVAAPNRAISWSISQSSSKPFSWGKPRNEFCSCMVCLRISM